MKIDVEINFNHPEQKYINVRCDLTLPKGGTGRELVMTLPSWTPGSYLVRDFATHIEAFQALDGNDRKLSHDKLSKAEWCIRHGDARKIRVTYKIYANDLSVRMAYMDHEFAFANAPAVFMHPRGFTTNPVTLKIKAPRGWRVAVANKAAGGVYRFANYDEFYDMPILTAASLEEHRFKIRNTTYRIAAFGPHHGNLEQVCRDMKKVLGKQITVFGDNPCREYLFQVLFVKGGYGGLEHGFSSTNIFDGSTLADKKRYPIFIALLAHEHFHLWNVKRIRPRALGPFDYTRENYTHELWIAEGITSYYDDHTVYRGGIYNADDYLRVVAENIDKLELQKGTRVNSLSEASFDAWIRHYRPNENSQNRSISYYLKGSLVIMLLDFLIIRKSAGRHNFDDMLRALYAAYKRRPELGLTREEFFAHVEKLTGASSQKFIADHIDGTATIDWNSEFAPFGIEVVQEKNADSDDDKNFFLGVTSKEQGGKVLIDKLTEDSPAYRGILQPGDEFIAINGERIENVKQLNAVLNVPRARIIIARRGRIYETELHLERRRILPRKLVVKKNLTPLQRKYFGKFLRQ